ncbi:hypothetical protein TNCV_882081 [Trichonephila clavipes]|nr:hypothetical protein TNCV_882081 [Trichonephila clavipes]
MEEMVEELQEQRNQLRQDAKRNIQKIQAENKKTNDRKRKKAWERVTLFGGVRETHSPNSVSCKQQEQGRCKNCSCNFRDRRPPIST